MKSNKKIIVPRFKKELGFITTPERSILMSKIKGSKTKPEQKLRKAIWAAGIRYRVNVKKLPGAPDIVISKSKLVIFVDGEFWHGFNWKEKRKKIKTNREFWLPKIERNMQRDKENNAILKSKGYKVLRFWEHQIKKDIIVCINKILSHIK